MTAKNKKTPKKSVITLHKELVSLSYLGTTIRALLLLVLFTCTVLIPILPFMNFGSTTNAFAQVLLLLVLFFIVVVVYDALYVTLVKVHRTTYSFDRWFPITIELACLLWVIGFLFETTGNTLNMIGMWLFTLAIVLPLVRLMIFLLPKGQKK